MHAEKPSCMNWPNDSDPRSSPSAKEGSTTKGTRCFIGHEIALGAPGTCSSCQHLYNQAENNRALLATLDL